MDEQAGPSTKRFKEDPVKIIHITELKKNGSSNYFSGDEANTEAIYGTFNKFGKVKSVSQYKSWCYRDFCTIEFEDEHVAARLLKKGWLKIDGSTLQMRSVNEHMEPDFGEIDVAEDINPLLVQLPAQDSPKNIVNALNDHCLCEIFRKTDHLADFDSIANVCKRFNQIAKLLFPSKFHSRWIGLDDLVFNDGTSPFERITLTQFEKFLSNFGSFIVFFKFRSFYLEEIPNFEKLAFNMISTYCKNIRGLDVAITDVLNEIVDEIRPIFSKLTKLHIHFSGHEPVSDFISICTELEELEIEGWPRSFHMPDVALPSLIKFKFRGVVLSEDFQPTLQRFLAKNLQIEEIEIFENLVNSEMIQFISDNMPNLKDMKFPSFYQTN